MNNTSYIDIYNLDILVSMAIVVAAIVIILTEAIITPLAAFAYSLKVPRSSGTDDGPSIVPLVDRNANNPQGESIARVKPPTDLQGSSSSGTANVAPISRNIAALGDEWWNWAFSIDTSDVGNPSTDTIDSHSNIV
jgi:hypothetical protein